MVIAPLASFVIAVSSVRTRRGSVNTAMLGALITLAATLLVGWGLAKRTTGFTASPWAYNGKIFVLSEDGDTYVIQAGPEFKVVGKNSLSDMPLATPAVLRGSLIIRTQSKLYRIAKKGQK